ncbi:MAG: J domain-containing protein, partial [Thermomicrobiales bacterium]
NIKAYIPTHNREYVPETKVWVIAAPSAPIAIQLMRSVYSDTILIDNRHVHSDWKFSKAEPAVDPNFATLYVMPTAPRCVVEAAYKALSKQFHPDRASVSDQDHAHEQMVRLNSAFEAVRDRIAS